MRKLTRGASKRIDKQGVSEHNLQLCKRYTNLDLPQRRSGFSPLLLFPGLVFPYFPLISGTKTEKLGEYFQSLQSQNERQSFQNPNLKSFCKNQ